MTWARYRKDETRPDPKVRLALAHLATAQPFIALLRDAGLLHTARLPRGSRDAVYAFTKLIAFAVSRSLR